jgi:hypothetical protein
MIGAGFLSGSFGYSLGREALKGITQPDTRPGNALVGSDASQPRHETVTFLEEETILSNVKARMNGTEPVEEPVENTTQTKALSEENSADSQAATDQDPNSFVSYNTSEVKLPISSQDDGVVLQVLSVHQQENALVLDVSLQNQGSESYRFLYSFMDITDNLGRTFNGSTEGLPGSLPANSETYYGTVSIPIALLDGAESLSLTLTDYPDQQIEIQTSDIPVGR